MDNDLENEPIGQGPDSSEENTTSTPDNVTPSQAPFSNPEAAWGNLDRDFVSNENDEQEVLKAFIGKNAESIMTSKTNWIAAILGELVGPIWFFYRKCYLIGFLFLILTSTVSSIIASLGLKEAYVVMFFIYLFAANPVYLWHAKRKVSKIISENSHLGNEALLSAAQKKGGVSVVAAIIYSILFILFIVSIIALILLPVLMMTSNYVLQ